jgi:hypothetical protein
MSTISSSAEKAAGARTFGPIPALLHLARTLGGGLEDHPTVKPPTMLVDVLFDLTNRREIVLDPFLGSGSTLIAAERTGRCCRGVELDPLYIDVILRRYQAETGHSAVLEETGKTFDELQENRSRPCGDARGLAGGNPP